MQNGAVGFHENLIYILIVSVILSLLSTFYYLRLIKMALFDNFETTSGSLIEVRGMGDLTFALTTVAVLGVLTVS